MYKSGLRKDLVINHLQMYENFTLRWLSDDFQSIDLLKNETSAAFDFLIRTRNIRDIYIYISFTKFSSLKDKIYVLNIDKRYWRDSSRRHEISCEASRYFREDINDINVPI